MREKPRDKGRLLHILQAIDNIEELLQYNGSSYLGYDK